MGMNVPIGGELMDLGHTVRARRKHLGLTQVDVADLAGVSVRFLRELELGKRSVQFDSVLAVLEVLGLEASFTVRTPAIGVRDDD